MCSCDMSQKTTASPVRTAINFRPFADVFALASISFRVGELQCSEALCGSRTCFGRMCLHIEDDLRCLFRRSSLDYGEFDAEVRPGWVVHVHHFERDAKGNPFILLSSDTFERNTQLIDLAIDEHGDVQDVLQTYAWYTVLSRA